MNNVARRNLIHHLSASLRRPICFFISLKCLKGLAIPEFSGIDIFRELKKENLLESKNVLIFTASSVTDQELKEMLSSGAKGVLRKPLSIDELIEAVERFSKNDDN